MHNAWSCAGHTVAAAAATICACMSHRSVLHLFCQIRHWCCIHRIGLLRFGTQPYVCTNRYVSWDGRTYAHVTCLSAVVMCRVSCVMICMLCCLLSSAQRLAVDIINYILGDSGRSLVVGFGNNPPTHAHHRAASCPNKPAPCGQVSDEHAASRTLNAVCWLAVCRVDARCALHTLCHA